MATESARNQDRRALEIFESALELDLPARESFARGACGADRELWSRVAALLASSSRTGDFLESPVTIADEALPADPPPRLAPGDRFGNFAIESRLGEGGMGEVYRASDTRLDRPVAIKLLRADFADCGDLRRRLLREARTISRLNHPNICTVYDVGERDGLDYLVMEYLDGETLSRRLSRGPLPLDEALRMAIEVADGLEEAHAAGIVHRDLKPGNVMLTPTGAKVLDFGLAKPLLHGAEPEGSTRQDLQTSAGTILGTPSYMSPQQARGENVDRQADVWAFGCILYEALTGKVAHPGDSYADTLVSVLERDPDWDLLPADTPPRIRTLLRRCLEKDLRRRLHDIADARIEIEESGSGESDGEATVLRAVQAVSRRWTGIAAVVGVVSAAVSGLLVWWLLHTTESPSFTRSLALSIGLPAGQTLAFGSSAPANLERPSIAISRDGSKVVYAATEGGTAALYLRRLDDAAPALIPGTEGAFHAFFAPDGERIGFFNGEGLYRSSLRGGQPVPLCEVGNPFGGAWNEDDTIVIAVDYGNRLLRLSADGLDVDEITPAVFGGEYGSFLWPEFLPDGRTLLFSSRFGRRIGTLSLQTGAVSTLLERVGGCARYSRSGHLLCALGGDLYAARLHEPAARPTDRPAPVLSGVRTGVYDSAHYAISENGTIAYVAGRDMDRGTLAWVDIDASSNAGTPSWEEAWPGENKYGSFRLSPDRSRVAVEIRSASSQIWIYELDGRERSWRLTSEGDNYAPVWSPDGTEVYFACDHGGSSRLLRRRADGTGGEVALLESPSQIRPTSLSADGILLLTRTERLSLVDLLHYRVGDDEPEVLLRTRKTEWGARFSPDGRLVAYTSDETPRMETFVLDYRRPEKLLQVSTHGGEEPIWFGNEKLFYRNVDQWMSVEIIRSPELEIGETRLVATGPYVNVSGHSYDHDPGRGRFLVIKGPAAETAEIRIITSWFDRIGR